MTYGTKGGFTYPVEEMSLDDRDWFLGRMTKQFKHEERAMKAATRKGRRR